MPKSSLIREADYVREAETDDELSDGALDAHLPFVNPIATLALARNYEGESRSVYVAMSFPWRTSFLKCHHALLGLAGFGPGACN